MSYFSDIFTKVLHIPGIGAKTAQKIVAEFNNQKIRDDEDAISIIIHHQGSYKVSTSVKEVTIRDSFHKAEELLEETERMGVKMTSILDDDYPKKLKDFKTNPPVVISYKGDISSLNDSPSCGVIGTREPTASGFDVGVRVGELLAENNVVVVSGLAKGCDTAGHIGCLKKDGKTIAVLAHGLKHLYPKENKILAQTILEKGGALISEYFYNQPARPSFFVDRDRIQAGLSDNIFVVETGVKGGTMHTVKYAIDNDRKVFTYKHPDKYLNEDKAQGNQMLIREAKAIGVGNQTEFSDFLTYFQYKSSYHSPINYSKFDPSNFISSPLPPEHPLYTNNQIITTIFGDSIVPKKKKKPSVKIGKILKDFDEKKKTSENKEDSNSTDSQKTLWE